MLSDKKQEVMNTRSGDPDDRWKLSIKWIRLAAVFLVGSWLMWLDQDGVLVHVVAALLFGIAFHRLRLTEQRLDLVIDETPVELTLYRTIYNDLCLESTCNGVFTRSRLTVQSDTGWADHTIAVRGKPCRLRIFARPAGDGYTVSNSGRDFAMTVLRNRFVA